MCFFFSSRRRHTRFDCDWSSDVCSSDLRQGARLPRLPESTEQEQQDRSRDEAADMGEPGYPARVLGSGGGDRGIAGVGLDQEQIGRASCRERVEMSVVGGSVKKKTKR